MINATNRYKMRTNNPTAPLKELAYTIGVFPPNYPVPSTLGSSKGPVEFFFDHVVIWELYEAATPGYVGLFTVYSHDYQSR